MNKKGNIFEGMETFVGLVVGSIILIIIAFASITIASNMETKTGFDTAQVTPFWDVLNNTPVYFDWAVLLITLLTIGGSLIIFYTIDLPPFWYVVSWIFVILAILALIIFGSSISPVLSSFPTVVNQMLFIPFLINNLQWVSLIYFILAMIGLHIPK